MTNHDILAMTTDLGDELLKVIGQITVAYGQLENALAMSIKSTSDVSLTEAMEMVDGLSERSERAVEKFEIWFQNQQFEAGFEKAIQDARTIAQRRHDVVHALWAKNEDGDIRWLRKVQYRPIDVIALRQLRDDIFEAAGKINGPRKHGGAVKLDLTTSAAPFYTRS